MTNPARAARPQPTLKLKILCAPERDAYRIYVWPHELLPPDLVASLDAHAEMYPTYLDLEELDRQMQRSGATYERRDSIDGSFEIDADGVAGQVLARWLLRCFRSDVQGVT